jgi:hypothetical protein
VREAIAELDATLRVSRPLLHRPQRPADSGKLYRAFALVHRPEEIAVPTAFLPVQAETEVELVVPYLRTLRHENAFENLPIASLDARILMEDLQKVMFASAIP